MRKKSSFPEKSRGLFFTLGLVVAMSTSYWALTAEVETEKFAFNNPDPIEDETIDIPRTPYVMEKPKVKPKPIDKPIEPISPIDPFKPIKIIDDGSDLPDPWENLDSIAEVGPVEPEIIEPIPDALLDRRPVFPGCDITAEESERFACFQEMLYRRISECVTIRRNNGFDTNQKIWVQFVIGKNGKVTKVTFPREGDPYYTKQLEECLYTLPDFTPGFMGNRYVPTSFTVPVKITIQ